MSTINLGRVQGAGIFYSTASSGTSVAKSTLAPNGIVPLVGDSILFPNGDLRKITAVSGTNVTCGNVETNFKERPSNVLQEAVMINRTAGVTEGDMINLGYALGLEQGKQYIVKYTFNDVAYESITKYEAPTGLPLEGGELCLCQSVFAEGMTMTFPMMLGVNDYSASVEAYMNAAQNYGFMFVVDKHQITDDMIYMDDENKSSFYVRALQTANAQNAVTVELTSIEPFVENVADKAIADGEGNNIVTTYAKQNGNYSDMSVGNADKLGDKAASEYALADDIPDVSNFAKKNGDYPNMTVGNAEKLNDKAASEYALMTIKTAAEWKSQNPVLGAGVFGFDSTSKIIKIGDGSTAWRALPVFVTTSFSFEKASWADIAAISESGRAAAYFGIGEEKTIELTTGEKVTLVILGFNHDDLTGGGKAGMTIGMKELLATTYQMDPSNTNTGGWDESEMRTSTMVTLLSQLPSDLQGVIKQVNKKATAGGERTSITTSADKLFLFALAELASKTGLENSAGENIKDNAATYEQEGTQYEYFKNTVGDADLWNDCPALVKKLSNGGGSANKWLLRSPVLNDSSRFWFVNLSGKVGITVASASSGVSFGFCV